MSRVDGVLFDVDDTLVDTQAAFAEGVAAVRARYLPGVPVEREPEMLRHWRSDPGGHHRRYTRGETDHVTQRFDRAVLLHRTFGGPPLTREGFEAWDAVFWGAFERAWRPHPEAPAVLELLADAGVRLGVVTNVSVAIQRRKLAVVGMPDFPVLVGVDTLGFGKPDPRVFLEACERLGTDPRRTAYVGDEREVDAVGAARAGLVGVWLDRPALRGGADPAAGGASPGAQEVDVIDSLDLLPAVLGITGGKPALRR